MGTVTFDTLKFVERIEKAGMPREQAVALAEAQRESLAQVVDNSFATKGDIVRLERRMDGFESEIKQLDLRMTVKFGAMLVAAVGVLVAVIKNVV